MQPTRATRTPDLRPSREAFSLIELVIVVVIIGIIAAIAIPRLSRGAAGAADASLSGNLKVLRSAIDTYTTEHANTPPTSTDIANQLMLFTDDSGATSATKDSTHVYGPYLRVIPTMPVGAKKNQNGIDLAANASTATVGWIYNPTDGSIRSNTDGSESDAKGKLYSDY